MFIFFSGVIAERVNLRHFVTLGMVAAGVCSVLFGLAKTLQIHSLAYFIIVQVNIEKYVQNFEQILTQTM